MTMEHLVLALRVVIIGVLFVSGFAKLFDREGSAEAMIGFGVPRKLIPLGAFALPMVEIALASGLLFAATVRWSAILAALLFLAFTLGVGKIVLAKENLDCHCFGQLTSGPVSGLTLVRNIVFSIAALMVGWWMWNHTPGSGWENVGWTEFGVVLVVMAFIALGTVIYRLWQTQTILLGRIDELQAMIPAGRIRKPPIEESFANVTEGLMLKNSEGESVGAKSLVRSKSPALLIFVSSSCRACNALMPDIAAWQQEFDGLMPVSVIGIGDANEIRARALEAGVNGVFMRDGDELATRLKVNGNPTAVLVDHDGFMRAKPMLGGLSIRRGIEELRRQAAG